MLPPKLTQGGAKLVHWVSHTDELRGADPRDRGNLDCCRHLACHHQAAGGHPAATALLPSALFRQHGHTREGTDTHSPGAKTKCQARHVMAP